VKITHKFILDQSAVALGAQRELVLQAVRRWTMLLDPLEARKLDVELADVLREDAKLQKMERDRFRLTTVRRPNRKKRSQGK